MAVLAAFRSERFGAEGLETLRSAGTEIEPGALYPMLRRLESQRLLSSDRRLDDGRLKRFYTTTARGVEVLGALKTEQDLLARSLIQLMR
ncbi:PadR family transcriptional regulator [Qipengyuania sp. 6B39]|uniref:PadR family transcriptional regulator n=1 Tax=Qipengyuania proteolytica TaxID=2867239 RepID=UPI001C8A5220|nr:PadR family transcriptional regulator [Qipengyuania proteolytica]MBX7494304.1 PadR family transcriptional regulator [Qipengyuania proteolytica]